LETNIIYNENCLTGLKKLPNDSIDTIITSPPYWGLRDYGEETKAQWIDGWYGQLGSESTLDLYIEHMLQIMAELKRVLKKTGVIFWNHGDSYGSHRDWTYSDISLKQKLGKGGKQQGIKGMEKCLMLQNYRLIFRMIDEKGLILRNIIIWNKRNHMPSSVKDRLTNAYEPIFMLVKNKKYYFNLDAVRIPHKEVSKERILRAVGNKHKYIGHPEYSGGGGINRPRPNRRTKIPSNTAESFGSPRARYHREQNMAISQYQYNGSDYLVVGLHPLGKNPGDVWEISTQPFSDAHFATFPEKLIEPLIKAGCPENGIILDPFMGAGTTAVVARKLNRNFIGFELNPDYIKIANKRLHEELGIWL